MVGCHARFECGVNEDLFVAANFKDTSAAVSDIQIAVSIKSQSSGNTHAFDVGLDLPTRFDTVDISFVATRDIKIAIDAEREPGRVHHIGNEWSHGSLGT